MSTLPLRPTLTRLHRWVGVILAPIFLIVVLSGAVLSFRPIVAGGDAPAIAGVDAPALGTLVGRLGAISPITSVAVADGGRTVDLGAADPAVAGRWDLASGTRVAAAPRASFDVFGLAERIHKQLLVGLGLVVEIASWAMVALVVIGPFLGWRRLRATLMGWHAAAGWLAFPLVLLPPLTAVLMTLHVGESHTPLPRAAHPVSVAEALAVAAPEVDLSTLVQARPFRGGTVMLRTAAPSETVWVVTDTGAHRLVGGPSLVKQIHEGTWGGAWSGLLNFAASIALAVLSVTGPWSWLARRRRNRPARLAEGADVLVAHASQTGTATRFAEATARALEAGGEKVALAPLGTLTPEVLRRYRTVLLLVSSTGDGELPDVARGFVEAVTPEALHGVRWAMLALGDRTYPHFCGGAERLRTALRLAGAEEILPPHRADGDPTPAWSAWLADLDRHLGLKLRRGEEPVTEAPVPLVLETRFRLDDPSRGETRETWAVTLRSATPLRFRPGDLVRLVPEPGARERTYSIGTSSRIDPHVLVLTVALECRVDAAGEVTFGAMSERLIRSLPLGAELGARIVPHASFNPPDDPTRPIVMVAAGSGVAPFYGFPAERAAFGRAGPSWLIFGNRIEAADFLWKEHFEAALADGSLTRLDTAFSPAEGIGTRVQERLLLEGEELHRWLVERNAVLYVCGRRAMVDGVIDAVVAIFARHVGLSPAAARAEVDARIAAGLVRIDAFG